MNKKLVVVMAVIGVLAFAGWAVAAPPFPAKWIITYDGYLQEDAQGAVLADTLFVVNNAHSAAMPVWIEVFNKYGEFVQEGPLYDGGDQVTNAPTNGYVWVTLGMIVGRVTHDPWGFAGGEKFLVKITTGTLSKTPTVEVKQVIYNTVQEYPGEAIWQAGNIKTWAETCLGGIKGPGVVKVPKVMKW